MAEESTNSATEEQPTPEGQELQTEEQVLAKDTYSKTEVQDLLREALADEVKGLKANNQALKEEKKKAQEKAKETSSVIEQIGGEKELQRILEIKKQLEADEELKLFASGDREKYNEKITARAKADHAAQVKKLTEANKELQAQADIASERYRMREITNAISDGCAKAGVNPRLVGAMAAQVEKVVFYDQESDAVMVRDPIEGGIRYGKEGTPMSVTEYVDSLREDQQELFLQSTGSGAMGSQVTRQGSTVTMDSIKNMGMDEYKRLREAGAIA